MKKRVLIVIVPSILLGGVIIALILSQFSNRLPAEAEDILESYLEAVPGEVMLTTVSHARNYDQFTADMGRPIMHAPIEEYRTSPILYDGDIIRSPEPVAQFPFPVQQLWCVALIRQDKAAEYYFLARHDNLYGATWVLYESKDGRQATQTTGCDQLLPVD
jgi:hypothetical protein